MAEGKDPVTQDDELFVLKDKLISESTKKTMEIHDLIKKMEDPEKNQQWILSPDFELAGVDFSIAVFPDCSANGVPGFISVFLHQNSNEEQMVSVTIKEASGVVWGRKMKTEELEWGCYKFLSQEKYREWAKTHGDVLKLEVVVTLHSKAESDGWTR